MRLYIYLMLHVISWSGGKDSTATIILMHQHRNEIIKEGDRVVILFSEVMFDKEKGISGHNPDIISFIHGAKGFIESQYGFTVEILHSDKDFLDVFFHKLTRSPDPSRVGMTRGFPRSGICSVQRDCKLAPIHKWKKEHSQEASISYVGIAYDEEKRLESLHRLPDTVSLLEKYKMTESDAMRLCEENNLLSPQYNLNGGMQTRDGCWFCPNSKVAEHRAIMESDPETWKRYIELEHVPNLAYAKFNPYSDETLHERDARIRSEGKQISLFDDF